MLGKWIQYSPAADTNAAIPFTKAVMVPTRANHQPELSNRIYMILSPQTKLFKSQASVKPISTKTCCNTVFSGQAVALAMPGGPCMHHSCTS